jgi:hypothetical protein
MRHAILALALIGCSADHTLSPRTPTDAPSASSLRAPVHALTGSGTVQPAPGFAFGTNAAIQQDASGRVWGTVVVHIRDMSLYGLGTGEFTAEPVCMRVVGNTAYVSMRTVRSAVPQVSAVGDLGVLWVRDNGNAGDVSYGGPAAFFDPANLICSDTPPALPATVVTQGNFTVR